MKMIHAKPILGLAVCAFVLSVWPAQVQAAHAVAHTHIGINPTWRPADWANPGVASTDSDPTDDNKLWFFSVPPIADAATPGWPNWEQTDGSPFLVLTPVLDGGEYIAKDNDPNKRLYTCSFTYSKAAGYGDPNGWNHLDGWHSAHGPQGTWNLQSVDAATAPAWDIYIRREGVSSNLDADDVFALLPNDTAALVNDGDIYELETEWLPDKNAWGLHAHMGFYFWLDESDQEVSVVISAHDAGGVYERSANFAIRFARTVVQPIPGDLNGDGLVGIEDLEILIENWGLSGSFSGDRQEANDHDHDPAG